MIYTLDTKHNPQMIRTLVDIWLEGNLDAHSFISQHHFKDHIPYVQQAFDSATIYIINDDNDGTIAGFAGLVDTYIAGFFIKKSMQHKGFGSSLIEHLVHRYQDLSLDVYKKNQRAINFYLHNGFCIERMSVDMATAYVQYTMRQCQTHK